MLFYALIRFGQTVEPIPADWLAMAAFHYEKGLLRQARHALDAAIAKTREIESDLTASSREAVPALGAGWRLL